MLTLEQRERKERERAEEERVAARERERERGREIHPSGSKMSISDRKQTTFLPLLTFHINMKVVLNHMDPMDVNAGLPGMMGCLTVNIHANCFLPLFVRTSMV